jgi:hypothetical protein
MCQCANTLKNVGKVAENECDAACFANPGYFCGSKPSQEHDYYSVYNSDMQRK